MRICLRWRRRLQNKTKQSNNAQSGSIKDVAKNERHKSHAYTRSVTHDMHKNNNLSYMAGINLHSKNESETHPRNSGIVNKNHQNLGTNVKLFVDWN